MFSPLPDSLTPYPAPGAPVSFSVFPVAMLYLTNPSYTGLVSRRKSPLGLNAATDGVSAGTVIFFIPPVLRTCACPARGMARAAMIIFFIMEYMFYVSVILFSQVLCLWSVPLSNSLLFRIFHFRNCRVCSPQ